MFRHPVNVLALMLALPLAAQTHRGSGTQSGGEPGRSASTGTVAMPVVVSSGRSFRGSDFIDHRAPSGTIRSEIRTVPASPGGTRVSRHTRVIVPPPIERLRTCPDMDFWRTRDLFTMLQLWARRGAIPVVPVDDYASLEDFSLLMAGWKAYGMTVPPKESVTFTLDHSNRAWFSVNLCNKWGQLEQGMLHSKLHRGTPTITYTNPFDEPRHVYLVVDDPGLMSSMGNPYTLTLKRSWDPGKYQVNGLPAAAGIWAVHRPDKPSPKLAVALWR